MNLQVWSADSLTGMVTSPVVDVGDVDPLIGEVLNGRFRIVELAGSGGMGRVYRAVQQPLNRAVALKVLDLNHGVGKDRDCRQRFLVEAALTSKLTHPNTVTVLDYGCTPNGICYIAMEYLDGLTLDRVLKSGGPLPWRRALGIGQQVARSLREAHGLGVAHRDLKPSNVMLLNADDEVDLVKVLDFGLVKSFILGEELEGRAITRQGMLVGSPSYMAPEQGSRNHADPRSDVYSLGAVLYEALTGEPAFTGRSAMEIVLKHVNQPVPPMCLPADAEQIPPEVEALVDRCLAKSPMDRFQSMDEVLDALQGLLAADVRDQDEATGELFVSEELLAPIGATPPDEVPRFAPRSRRLLPLLVAVLLGAGATTLWAGLRTPAPTTGESSPAVSTLPPPESAPAESPPTVTFRVESEPSGATVRIDGAVVGRTPVDLQRPGPTTAVFSLALPGFDPVSLAASGTEGTVVAHEKLRPVTDVARHPKGKVPSRRRRLH